MTFHAYGPATPDEIAAARRNAAERECPDCVKLKRRIARTRFDCWRRHLERKLSLHRAIAGAGWP